MNAGEIEGVQTRLADDVFDHTDSPRKAAGRALGTLVEVITYYLLRSWGLEESISIETPLQEYGNSEITHNVEYTLHGVEERYHINMHNMTRSEAITAHAIKKSMLHSHDVDIGEVRSSSLLTRGILRNSCLLNKEQNARWIANYDREGEVTVSLQHRKPYAVFECKRVGLDAQHGKGPQAIEKAKQGSYVARTVSCLQKVRDGQGNVIGIIYDSNNKHTVAPYNKLFHDIVYSEQAVPANFIMTVGVVSNHGNWFTANNQNKEMKILAQSYDWLLFLTDRALAYFVDDVVLSNKHPHIRTSFLESYTKGKKHNQFTKISMNLEAHRTLAAYFMANIRNIEDWFTIITPHDQSMRDLHDQIDALRSKMESEP